VVLLALVAAAGPVRAGELEDRQAQASAIAAKLAEQAQGIVDLDKEQRRAAARLADADADVARAEADLAASERRQDEARRLLVAHAQSAYAGGGSVSFLGKMARATVLDAGARRTYLGIAANEDQQAIGRLRAAKEDLLGRRKSLAEARKAAATRADAAATDVAQLQGAIAAQRALLVKVNGDVAQMVAAEQAKRDAEAARLAAARQAAVAVATTKAPAATKSATAPAAADAPAATTTTAAPLPILGGSVDATFACIRQLESGNNYKAPGGGAYQFQDATWHSLGYSGTASDAPPAVQDEAARKLQARDGWSPWTTAPLCGRV
jgi:peptidoglycan hydrolase CwlO-like protein